MAVFPRFILFLRCPRRKLDHLDLVVYLIATPVSIEVHISLHHILLFQHPSILCTFIISYAHPLTFPSCPSAFLIKGSMLSSYSFVCHFKGIRVVVCYLFVELLSFSAC